MSETLTQFSITKNNEEFADKMIETKFFKTKAVVAKYGALIAINKELYKLEENSFKKVVPSKESNISSGTNWNVTSIDQKNIIQDIIKELDIPEPEKDFDTVKLLRWMIILGLNWLEEWYKHTDLSEHTSIDFYKILEDLN